MTPLTSIAKTKNMDKDTALKHLFQLMLESLMEGAFPDYIMIKVKYIHTR